MGFGLAFASDLSIYCVNTFDIHIREINYDSGNKLSKIQIF